MPDKKKIHFPDEDHPGVIVAARIIARNIPNSMNHQITKHGHRLIAHNVICAYLKEMEKLKE